MDTFLAEQNICFQPDTDIPCLIRGTAATTQPSFRLGDPAFCGSRPLVTP